ncbi:uncharacterized protein LOC135075372 [Ostrinia nubilalis]|uniref:uncharacterized protein LOC135075372 n=1 Tax=Ostrinia nubilalis TaxID=29057 RepID=UPI0030823650
MTVFPESKQVEEPAGSIKGKCVNCLKGSNLIKTLVVIVCVGVVIQQIVTCINKLIDIPITTYTHFDFNRTLVYPSITFCREPPYKFDRMLEYGLITHPVLTSAWRNFNFSAVPLDKLWKDITYEPEEFFAQYGLNGEMHNVEVKETIGFMFGRCYTLTPKILSTRATRETGLSITLQYDSKDAATSVSIHPPGYHAYIHYSREPYTEVAVYNGGLIDYLYCKVGETIDVKLSVNKYVMISDDSEPCASEDSYSANTCTTKYVWDEVGQIAGCSGPWMKSDLPACDNFQSMRDLIVAYTLRYQAHNCSSCPRYCTSYLYNGFVTDRHMLEWDMIENKWTSKTGGSEFQTQLFVYFNNMMVSVYEERYNYDWNLFLSDLGGSVGFLLGLSVIGLMSIFGKIWNSIIKPYFQTPKTREDVQVPTMTPASEDIYKKKEMYDYCKTINWKNLYN